MSKRGQAIALGVLAVVVAGVVVASYINFQAKIEAAQGDPGPTSTFEPQPTLAFLGDSYTAGVGANGDDAEAFPEDGYAGATAFKLDAEWAANAQGGTGYLNPGQKAEHETTFVQRAPRLRGVDPAPDVVVVQGGGNDVLVDSYTDATEAAAVDKVLATIGELYPDAQVVVLGPVLAPGSEPEKIAAVTAVLRAESQKMGATFIDPKGWLTKPKDFISDGFHPSPRGHQIMAARLAGELRPML